VPTEAVTIFHLYLTHQSETKNNLISLEVTYHLQLIQRYKYLYQLAKSVSKRKILIKNKLYMYLVEHNNVFIALIATSFGHYDQHQASDIQNLKRLDKCSAKNVVVWDPIYIKVNIC
jgi:hypothetical protein